MASLVKATRTFASKRWFAVAAWILAAVVAGCFNLMQYANFNLIQNSPRTRATVRAASGDGVATVAVPEANVHKRPAYHKVKTHKEQLADMVGGIAAGGATAVMLFVSAAATISILNPSSHVASERAGPSVVVPLAKIEVPSTPLDSKAVATLAPRADGGLLGAIMAARANTVIVAPAAPTSIAPADVQAPIVARLIAALAPEVAVPSVAEDVVSSVAEDVVEVNALRSVVKEVAPAETPKAASHKNSNDMSTFYGYQKPTSLYAASK